MNGKIFHIIMPVPRNIVKDMNIRISCLEKQNKTINSLQFKDLMILQLLTIPSLSALHNLGIQKLNKNHVHVKLNPMEVCKVRLEPPLTLFYFDNSKMRIVKYKSRKVMGDCFLIFLKKILFLGVKT